MTDLISRAAAKEAIEKLHNELVLERAFDESNGAVDALHVVLRLPAVDAIPVEWLLDKMQKSCATDANPFGYVLAEWLEEQEAR